MLARASAVFHFAAQTAVTSSLSQPRHDFEVNAGGTLNVLEVLRGLHTPPPLIVTSTNKVYGRLDTISLRRTTRRYEPEDTGLQATGIAEDRALDFHSPYGCSKGAADQYVLDYARTFGIPAIVFRMSCIYGPRQFGTEDQGWLAHFLITALRGDVLTVYGDGRQVRDVLFIDDLLDAFLLALRHRDAVAGSAYNIGGGPRNAVSLRELVLAITELTGRPPHLRWASWRAADQRYYVSNSSRFQQLTGWSPAIGVRAGVERLLRWLQTAEPGLFDRDATSDLSGPCAS